MRCREQRARDRVRRAAQADAVLVPGGGGTDRRHARQDQGQRAGPEGVDQALRERRHGGRERCDQGRLGHVDDQRVVLGAALETEDLQHGRRVVGACAEAVDSFGRERDELTLGEQVGRALDRTRVVAIEPHRHQPSRSSSAAASRATATARALLSAVTVRCPILRPGRGCALP